MTDSRFNASLRAATGFTLALVDEQGRILDTSAVTCAWAGTPRFDAWFRGRYGDPDYLSRDGGTIFRVLRRSARTADEGQAGRLRPHRRRKHTRGKEAAA